MKKQFLSIFLILTLAGAGSLFAVDFSLRLNPGVAIPLKEHYKPAFNMTAQADLQLFDWVTLGGEGSFLSETPEGASSATTFFFSGMTSYIGSKSFFKSTPKTFFGKSLICPKLAKIL